MAREIEFKGTWIITTYIPTPSEIAVIKRMDGKKLRTTHLATDDNKFIQRNLNELQSLKDVGLIETIHTDSFMLNGEIQLTFLGKQFLDHILGIK